MAVSLDTLAKKINNIEQFFRAEQITEKEACELLGISKETIQVYVSNKSIPIDCYTIGIKGKRFYFKQKLMNQEFAK